MKEVLSDAVSGNADCAGDKNYQPEQRFNLASQAEHTGYSHSHAKQRKGEDEFPVHRGISFKVRQTSVCRHFASTAPHTQTEKPGFPTPCSLQTKRQTEVRRTLYGTIFQL